MESNKLLRRAVHYFLDNNLWGKIGTYCVAKNMRFDVAYGDKC